MVEKKKISEVSSEEIKSAVKEAYTQVAQPTSGSCCGSTDTKRLRTAVEDDSSITD